MKILSTKDTEQLKKLVSEINTYSTYIEYANNRMEGHLPLLIDSYCDNVHKRAEEVLSILS